MNQFLKCEDKKTSQERFQYKKQLVQHIRAAAFGFALTDESAMQLFEVRITLLNQPLEARNRQHATVAPTSTTMMGEGPGLTVASVGWGHRGTACDLNAIKNVWLERRGVEGRHSAHNMHRAEEAIKH